MIVLAVVVAEKFVDLVVLKIAADLKAVEIAEVVLAVIVVVVFVVAAVVEFYFGKMALQ